MTEINLTFLETNKTVIYGTPTPGMYPDTFMESTVSGVVACSSYREDLEGKDRFEFWFPERDSPSQGHSMCSIYDIHYKWDV